ncbi:alpha/beta hydrolase [Erwinia sp. CPCC 100877]|nr:alpha/beta hydrolase [Erwinia sp. CPCC 100877]
MHSIFQEGSKNGKKLILLHGTGGDETSLMDIGRYLDEQATLLAFRGTVQEEGMNRFFKRNGLNQFDYESLEQETDRLLREIQRISQEKAIPLSDWVLVGYSNGANIAAHLLLERAVDLKQAILFHPMSLGVDTQDFTLKEKQIWLSFGENDPIVAEVSVDELIGQLEKREAVVSIFKSQQGHQVTLDELAAAKKWLSQLK